MAKVRLDVVVQERAGVSRSKAQGLIHTGNVFDAAGARLDKPGQMVDEDIQIDIRGGPKYVSRGGDKIEAALAAFASNVDGLVAIDVGASTGGFTDCLLQHGAAHVYAVDVGYGQLHWKLRQDPRVTVIERMNIRNLDPASLSPKPSFFAVDCSFISLKIVLAALRPLLALPAEGVALIKPQFEAGRESVGKGGVVRDPAVHDRVIADVFAQSRKLGFIPDAVIPSPLLGPAGNREFLVHLRAPV